MGQLLSFPCLPATSQNDPNVPIPAGIVGIHRAMLEVRGFSDEFLDEYIPSDCELCRLSMLLQRWDSLIALGAIAYEPHRTLAAKNSRQALIRAIWLSDPNEMYRAYRACVDEDGLPELQKDWDALVRALPDDEREEEG